MALTLQEATDGYALWKGALDAVSTGKGYRILGRRLERTDAAECQKMVLYYQKEIARLSAGRGPGARVIRIVPRDF